MTKITKFPEYLEYWGKFLKQKSSKVYKNIYQQKDNFISFSVLFISQNNYIYFLKLLHYYWHHVCSLFWEEISACAAVHGLWMQFMDTCHRVRSIILLPPIMGMSFVLVKLTRLIVSKPKHRVIWSHRTCINFPFLRGGKNPIL